MEDLPLKEGGAGGSDDKGNPQNDWEEVLRLLDEGRIHPERVITHSFELGEIERGFRIMRDKSEEYIKIMMQDHRTDGGVW